jgi:DNA gyrase subunit A
VQTLFKLDDGERIIRMVTLDSRLRDVPTATEGAEEPEPPFALAVTKRGLTLRFSLRGHREPSTRAGRRYLRLNEGDEAIYVAPLEGEELVACATETGHALICRVDEVALLSGPGKGVMLIKLAEGDRVVGASLLGEDGELVVENESGRQFSISTRRYDVVTRAGKGFQLFKRGALARVVEPPVVLRALPEAEGGAS